MVELKPCPFCGGEASSFEAKGIYSAFVRCGKCDLELYGRTEAEAVEVWNRRAALSAHGEAGEVKVKPLDEDDYEEIISAAAINMRKAASGIRGQVITVQDSIDWWVMKETERRILSALEAAATCNESLQVEPAAPEGQQPVADALELSGNTGELIDRMAAAIRDWGSHYDDGPWETLPEDRKAGWRGDAERALAVVKEYLTTRRPAEQAVAWQHMPGCGVDREAKMVTVAEGVFCDPCIAPLVAALNTAGIETVASCCGHGHRPGVIALRDGRELFIAKDFDEARKIESIFTVDINGNTRPAEQAVSEAMVEAAVQAVRQYTRETLFIDEHRELVRDALKAAMEAGRHD